MLKIDQHKDILNKHSLGDYHVVYVAYFMVVGFALSNQYCEQMRKLIFTN